MKGPFWLQYVILGCFFLPSCLARGQDTIPLRLIEIIAAKEAMLENTFQTTQFDSSTLSNNQNTNIGELLSKHSPVFIKGYYGSSSLSGTIRGGSANQFQVNWHGVPLESSMLGQTDLSLIPVFFFDDISLVHGGAGSILGNGAVSGSLNLINNPININLPLSVFLSAGSFNDYSQGLAVNYGKTKLRASTKLFHRKSLNNFPYMRSTRHGEVESINENSGIEQSALFQRIGFGFNKFSHIQLEFWYNRVSRQIPPAIGEKNREARQEDENFKLNLSWSHTSAKAQSQININHSIDHLDYTNPLLHIASESMVGNYYGEAEQSRSLSSGTILRYGLLAAYSSASTNDYNGNVERERFGAFAAVQQKFGSAPIIMVLGARQEYSQNNFNPFIPTFGIELPIGNLISVKANATKVFRLPTLNDLFWQPGGNPNLLPEEGWAQDINLSIKDQTTTIKWAFGLGAYNRVIDNWITWMPSETFWVPRNFKKVWSRGLEINAFYNVMINQVKISSRLNMAYNRSTNQMSSFAYDNAIDKQLIYTPEWSGNGELSISYKTLQISAFYNYNGKRFINPDNSIFLESYGIFDLQMQKQFRFRKHNCNILLRANNVFSTEYMLLLNHPVPGANYQISISYNLKKTS